jgi:hypothetical protein
MKCISVRQNRDQNFVGPGLVISELSHAAGGEEVGGAIQEGQEADLGFPADTVCESHRAAAATDATTTNAPPKSATRSS